MPKRLNYEQAIVKTVSRRSVKCRQCGNLLASGQEYVLVGASLKLCKGCYEYKKAEQKEKQNAIQSVLKTRTQKISQILTERKCPACGATQDLQILDYDVAKENKEQGAFVFTYKCQCGTQFVCQMDI
jgi:ribosome-binding protein aMBF1 (putative translation factor)